MTFADERKALVSELQQQGISNPAVIEAFLSVPREEFVPPDRKSEAYINAPLPIGNNQTISQPYTIALMMELLDPQAGDTILEVGTGSGYQAALLARIVKQVYTIERISELADRARAVLQRLGYANVTVIIGDGAKGYETKAPYNGIMVTAGARQIPASLTNQLAEGGRMVIPVGDFWSHSMVQIIRAGDTFQEQRIPGFMFVPLITDEE
jgi:protein-L-isoaspartate(D-aspartate) O-methyltransferase